MGKIGVIGCGYVGLVTGVCLAELGNDVVCGDIDQKKIDGLSIGISPIYEPELQPILEQNLRQEKVSFTTDLDQVIREADILFIAVGTPTTAIGTSDLSQVNSVIDRIVSTAVDEKIVVMKSTVPVGTGDKFCQFFGCNGLSHISYVSNPEFLREGQAVHDFMVPDRVVIGGGGSGAVERIAKLYDSFEVPFIYTSTTNAELIKYASNAFLATKISFINEIANLCDEVGADVSVVAEGMGHDPRINPYFLRAGIGYGGSCFPKDVKALKQLAGHNGYHFELLSTVIEVNEMQKTRPVQKLRKHLGELYGRNIGVLGLTFKPHTDDIRESVGIDVVKLLQFEGARVIAFDPLGMDHAKKVLTGVEFVGDPYKVADGVEAIVIATEDPFYTELDWQQILEVMANPLVIDGRNILNPDSLPEGIILDQIGRGVRIVSSGSDYRDTQDVALNSLRKAS